ncbi:acylphosphatase-2 isoform X1 [Pan troglodytes]|nr:acylphosphatase-2 isoform X1 [Pan troglodytes]
MLLTQSLFGGLFPRTRETMRRSKGDPASCSHSGTQADGYLENTQQKCVYKVSLFYLGCSRTPNVKLSSCLGLPCCWDYSYKFVQLSEFGFGQVIIVSEEPWKENISCSSTTFIKSTICLSVCFRMYTEDEARKIGVVGWVKNTSKGTVTGQVQGPEDKVNSMKSWLSKVGSPSSRIDRTNFSNEKTISKLEYSNFSIRY